MTGNEDEANELLERHLERSLPGSDALVLRRNNSDNRLEVISAQSSADGVVEGLEGAEPRACIAIRYGRAHRQGGSDPAARPVRPVRPGPRRGEATCVPSLVGGQVIGSVLVRHPHPLSEAEDARIGDSVTQAAPILANLRTLAKAERQAATDALTGMANARAVQDTLKRMVAQALRTGDPLTAVMVDLDHFKQLNDVYGHERGNEALAAVGQILAAGVRVSDFAGRYGGEEFILLLPDTGARGRRRPGREAAPRAGRARPAGGRSPDHRELRRRLAARRRRSTRRRSCALPTARSTRPRPTGATASSPLRSSASSRRRRERLAGDVARARRAQERGGRRDLLRLAQPAARAPPARAAASAASREPRRRDTPVGRDAAREQGVERHAVAGDLARERLERREHRSAVGVGEHEGGDRLAHRGRRDVHDPAEAALAHARDRRARRAPSARARASR